MQQQTTTGVAARMPPFLRGPAGIVILVSGALIIILLVITFARAVTPHPAPNAAEVTAQHFYADLRQQKYDDAWGLLADQQQAQLTQFAFVRFAQEQDQKYGAVTAFHETRYDADRNHTNQGVVQMNVTRAKTPPYLIGLTITRGSDGTWKILEEDHAI